MTKTMSECLIEMNSNLEKIDVSKPDRIGSPSLGDVVRQGDLYLVCIQELPKGKPTNNRQLAPGNTQGSRHILEGRCKIVECDKPHARIHDSLCGPAFHCEGEVTVAHPEHGHKILPEDTTWRVIYQQAYADEVRRVQD